MNAALRSAGFSPLQCSPDTEGQGNSPHWLVLVVVLVLVLDFARAFEDEGRERGGWRILVLLTQALNAALRSAAPPYFAGGSNLPLCFHNFSLSCGKSASALSRRI